mmetsp:Transcript_100213/g.287894  ORF Transcript_100213/g.287894 Transcript_100213/m.287894 type:complete len:233 (+) Transcript_100213:483-1181(+)
MWTPSSSSPPRCAAPASGNWPSKTRRPWLRSSASPWTADGLGQRTSPAPGRQSCGSPRGRTRGPRMSSPLARRRPERALCDEPVVGEPSLHHRPASRHRPRGGRRRALQCIGRDAQHHRAAWTPAGAPAGAVGVGGLRGLADGPAERGRGRYGAGALPLRAPQRGHASAAGQPGKPADRVQQGALLQSRGRPAPPPGRPIRRRAGVRHRALGDLGGQAVKRLLHGGRARCSR